MRIERQVRIVVLVTLAVLVVRPALAERWQVATDGAEVVFTSKAPLETFHGRTERLAGWVEFVPLDLAGPLGGEILVDLASLDTGKNKRNQHMRENHLETDTFPTARFRPEAVLSPTITVLPPAGVIEVRLRGVFELHGVPRPLECVVQLSRESGGGVKVATEFPVLLSDHDIERPKFLVMKLADEQKVAVTFVLRPEENQ